MSIQEQPARFVIPPGEARFTRKHPRYGVRVRVASMEDLTGQKVEVRRADGTKTRVRLGKRYVAATAANPVGLYGWERWTPEQRKALHHPALLRPRLVSRKCFVEINGVLVAEDSDLPGRFERVWNDACDVGLTIMDGDGREVVYAVNHEERRDGDLLWWDLIPAISAGERSEPRVQVFND